MVKRGGLAIHAHTVHVDVFEHEERPDAARCPPLRGEDYVINRVGDLDRGTQHVGHRSCSQP